MGKRTRTQRAGKGSKSFSRNPNAKGAARYPEDPKNSSVLRGEITDFVVDPVHSSPLARVHWENGQESLLVAAEGLYKGQTIQLGEKADQAIGNVLPLSHITEGCPVFGIERHHNDGGKIVRGGGSYALVISKSDRGVTLKLPSGDLAIMGLPNRATIGCAAGGGRTEKPLVKSGKAYHKFKARGKKYPSVRGVAQNPLSHPFGGGAHHAGKSKSTSRHAPPGRKVGAIASSRTGRLKR